MAIAIENREFWKSPKIWQKMHKYAFSYCHFSCLGQNQFCDNYGKNKVRKMAIAIENGEFTKISQNLTKDAQVWL